MNCKSRGGRRCSRELSKQTISDRVFPIDREAGKLSTPVMRLHLEYWSPMLKKDEFPWEPV